MTTSVYTSEEVAQKLRTPLSSFYAAAKNGTLDPRIKAAQITISAKTTRYSRRVIDSVLEGAL